MKKVYLTWFERKACLVMSKLKYNENGEFYKCLHNDICVFIACVLLGGRDPIEFSIQLMDLDTTGSRDILSKLQ